ncbi:MAG: hypothetical protein MJ214_03490 [Bacilli bacterium]|nr:hypothetical protein [Bacilli bacterium]
MFNEDYQFIVKKLIKDTCNENTINRFNQLRKDQNLSNEDAALGLLGMICAENIKNAIESKSKFSKDKKKEYEDIATKALVVTSPYLKGITSKDKKRFYEYMEAGIIAWFTYMTLNYFND